MAEPKKLPASFFHTAAGNEPVREWLKALDDADRRAIGLDIATAEFGWPRRRARYRGAIWTLRCGG